MELVDKYYCNIVIMQCRDLDIGLGVQRSLGPLVVECVEGPNARSLGLW